MAMVTCPECKNKISDSATSCPQCGAKAKKRTSRATIAIVGFVSIIMVMCTYNTASNPTATTPVVRTPEQIAKEAEFQAVVRGAASLKAAAKDPKSFKLESAIRMASGAMCYEYRATNSFNATVPGRAVFLSGVGSSNAADWNKHCAGKTGTNYTHARQAI